MKTGDPLDLPLPKNYVFSELDNSPLNIKNEPMNDFKSALDYLGGRKFVYVVLISIGAFSLAFGGKIDYNQLLEFLTWIFGLYAGANVGQKIGLKK
jgi:hypothetical protein